MRPELRSLLLSWLALCIGVALALAVGGIRPWDEAVWLGITLIPFGIAMVPIIWMHAGWGGFTLLLTNGWRPVVKVLAWAIVTGLIVLVVDTIVWRAVGIE